MANRRGFTLIELLIAVGCGSAIVLVAVAGFRSALQSLTAAQHIAIGNDLVAAGVVAALDEADWWDAYDQRGGEPATQRLRASVSPSGLAGADGRRLTLGLPFAPFRRAVNGFQPVYAPDTAQGFSHGWQDDERLWAISADNELTWWTGNKAETQESDCRFGHYAIFGVSRLPEEGNGRIIIDGGTSPRVAGWQPRNGGGRYGELAWGREPEPPRNGGSLAGFRHQAPGWFYNQIRALGDGLGWYGMFDYLPANTIICYATPYRPMVNGNYNRSPADATDSAGRPIFLIKTFASNRGFPEKPFFNLQTFSPNWCPHGMDFMTSYSAYSLIPSVGNRAENADRTMGTEELVFYNRSVVRMEGHDIPVGDWGAFTRSTDFTERTWPNFTEESGPEAQARFVARTSAGQTLLPVHPGNWPDIDVSVSRHLRLCRFSTQLKVSWFDAASGERADLRFTAMGTTLRGARRQRGLDL